MFMFHDVDLSQSIENIVSTLEANCDEAVSIRRQIQKLSINRDMDEDISTAVPVVHRLFDDIAKEDKDDFLLDTISLYHKVNADEDSIREILPDSDDYRYNDIIMRLHAESLKDIKDMSEMCLEDGSYYDEEVQSFIQNEYRKIEILQSFIDVEIVEEEDVGHSNKLLLIPNPNGKIRVLDDLDHVPNDYYDEVNSLIMSIVDGTFKKVKKFKSNNALCGGVCEVKGSNARVLFKRLDYDTYAIISVFLKKTNNDKGYQEFIRGRIGEFRLYEDEYKKKIEDSEFMELNDFYVCELFNRIGNTSKEKTYKKEIQDD